MSTKQSNEKGTDVCLDITPGDRLTIGGVEFAVLDKRPDGSVVLSPEFFDPDKEYKVPEEAAGSLDDQLVHILVRDCNGKRQTISFDNAAACVAELSSEDQTVIDCENDEILLVALGDMVLYCQLTGGGLDVEDIVGFFA